MSYTISAIIVYTFVLSFILYFIKKIRSKNLSETWSPITFIILTYIYYIIIPFFDDEGNMFFKDNGNDGYLMYIGAVLYFVSILFGFNRTRGTVFAKWNNVFSVYNCKRIGLFLFVFALICYVPFRGLHTSIARLDASYQIAAREGFVSYFLATIALFTSSACLLLVDFKNKKNVWIFLVIWLSLVTYIVAGFRYRIVLFTIGLATVFHLYPMQRRLAYIPLAILGISMYLGFAVMEKSRTYGRGLDMEKVNSMSLSDMSEGARENISLSTFSSRTMAEFNRTGDYLYFEPFWTAVCMPLPRTYFPWKPDGSYLKDIQLVAKDVVDGAAFFSFTEGFVSFGWFGIILYGLILGCIAKKIWSNYRNNPSSIGAILILALFNGFVYKHISRGYLSDSFIDFVFNIALPFWIAILIEKFSKKRAI